MNEYNIIQTYHDYVYYDNYVNPNEYKGFSISKFPDGEINVTLSKDIDRKKPTKIHIRINNSDDLFILMQLSDIINRQELFVETIYVHYLMGMRCDRVFSFDRPFTLKIIANIINSFNAQSVHILEPHSERCLQLINNSRDVGYSVRSLYCGSDEYHDDPSTLCVAPDDGAYNRCRGIYHAHFVKHRDATTGKLDPEKLEFNIIDSRFEQIGLGWIKNVVIVDDLCDGGGTFLMELNYLKENVFKDKDVKYTLIVTHAVNDKGLENVISAFDKVIVTDSYENWNEIFQNSNFEVKHVELF
jgi:ribose-phosphate pyrophosphokinase